MKKIMIVIFSLLLALTGCQENKMPLDNDTIVWKLLYDINTHPINKDSFVETNLMTKLDLQTYQKPNDYNKDAIKEVSCEKLFNALTEFKVCQLGDGLLVLTVSQGKKISLIKLDMSGKVIWENNIDVLGSSTTEITLLDNGNIVFGISDWPNTSLGSPSMQDGHILCYNQNGQQQWKYSYEDSIGCRIKYIFQDKSGDLLCTGLANTKDLSNVETDVIITKLSTNGEFIAEASFGGKDNEYLEGSAYSKSTGLIITGWTLSDDGEFASGDKDKYTDYVASIDESLKLNWVYKPKKPISYLYSQIQVQNGLIAITGFKSTKDEYGTIPDNENTYYFHILDSNGSLVHETEANGNSNFIGCAVCITNEQRIFLAYNTSKGTKIVVKNLEGKTISESVCKVTYPEEMIPTNDGGFIIKFNYPVEYLPQPAYISSIWMDTATTLSCYDKNGKLMWQKTYDDYPNHVIKDYLYVAH